MPQHAALADALPGDPRIIRARCEQRQRCADEVACAMWVMRLWHRTAL